MIRLIVGVLIALLFGSLAIGLIPAAFGDSWGTRDYGTLVAVILLPLAAGLGLIWSGWMVLQEDKQFSVRRAAANAVAVLALLFLAFAFATCSRQFNNWAS